MKRWIAIAACLLINGVAVSHLAAQKHANGYLGVGVANVTQQCVKELKLKDAHGVVVRNVEDGTPAAKAGLKESDVIVEFNGQTVDGVDRFRRVVRETPPNRKVTIRIIRGGAAQTISATLTSKVVLNGEEYFPVPPAAPMPPMPPMPRTPWDEQPPVPLVIMPPVPEPVFSWRQASIGIEAEQLSGQLADFFGVKEGVLVRSVYRNKPADRAGLKAGDVIVRVRETPVRTPQALSSEVASLTNAKTPVTLAVVRNHKETSVALKITWDDGR